MHFVEAVGIIGRIVGHSQDSARLGIHDDNGAAISLILGYRLRQLLLHQMLDVPVESQHQMGTVLRQRQLGKGKGHGFAPMIYLPFYVANAFQKKVMVSL